MIQHNQVNRYLQVGDRLVKCGKFDTAANVYSRFADACVAQGWLRHARERVGSDPITALQSLAKAEEVGGPSWEGRRLSAMAYDELGQSEIAARFRDAD
jgi:hypothetical protein